MIQCYIDSVVIMALCFTVLYHNGSVLYCQCYHSAILFTIVVLYCYWLCLLVLSLLYWFTVVCFYSVFIIPPLCAGQWGTTIIGVAAGELEWCSTSVLLFLVSFYVHSMCFMSIDCIIRVFVCIVIKWWFACIVSVKN